MSSVPLLCQVEFVYLARHPGAHRVTTTPTSPSERLRQAFEASPFRDSRRRFQQAVKSAGAPGSSYTSVRHYLDGATTPPVRFLEVAAEVLGVRPAWLALGEGGMTEEDEAKRVDTLRGDLVTGASLADMPERAVEIISEEFPPLGRASALVRAAVLEVWYYAAGDAAAQQEDSEEGAAALTIARNLGRALRAPLEHAAPERLTDEWWSARAYVLGMVPALLSAVPFGGASSVGLALKRAVQQSQHAGLALAERREVRDGSEE